MIGIASHPSCCLSKWKAYEALSTVLPRAWQYRIFPNHVQHRTTTAGVTVKKQFSIKQQIQIF
jgi:hypothetical protein